MSPLASRTAAVTACASVRFVGECAAEGPELPGAKHRPSTGVVAAWSEDESMLVVIGASGTARCPDGISVEVLGKPASTIIVIAGNSAEGGTAGAANGPEGSFLRPGR